MELKIQGDISMWVILLIIAICFAWHFIKKGFEESNERAKQEQRQKENREYNIIRRREISAIFDTDENFSSFLNKLFNECTNPKKETRTRRTGCWNCRRTLNSEIHLKCPMCGWLICACGSCSRNCLRTELLSKKSHYDYYVLHRNVIFNYIKANFKNYNDEIGIINLSSELHDRLLLIYICTNEKIIFNLNEKGFDLDGYNLDGYDNEGYNKLGYNKDGYDKEGYDIKGYDFHGFNREGKNKLGYGKDGYNDEGFDIKGFDRDGYNLEGKDRCGYGKDGYNDEGFDRKGFDRKGYDRNGYNKKGYNKSGYDREGYDIKGFNKYGFDRKGFDSSGYNSAGYDKEGYDKEGYDKEGFDRQGIDIHGYSKEGYDKDGYNRQGYNKEGYDKEGFNKYGWNKNGFNKKQQYCELIGKEVKHISCGKGVVLDFYSTEDADRFVVEYKNKSQGKFVFTEKVLKILDFGDFSPNFKNTGYCIERTYVENSDIKDKTNNNKSQHESGLNFDTYYDFGDSRGLPTWNENYEMDEDKQYKSEYIDMMDSANDSGWFYDDNDD